MRGGGASFLMYLPSTVNSALCLQLLGLLLWGTWPLFRQRSGVSVPAFAPLNVCTQFVLCLVGGAAGSVPTAAGGDATFIAALRETRFTDMHTFAIVLGGFVLAHGDNLGAISMEHIPVGVAFPIYGGISLMGGSLLNYAQRGSADPTLFFCALALVMAAITLLASSALMMEGVEMKRELAARERELRREQQQQQQQQRAAGAAGGKKKGGKKKKTKRGGGKGGGGGEVGGGGGGGGAGGLGGGGAGGGAGGDGSGGYGGGGGGYGSGSVGTVVTVKDAAVIPGDADQYASSSSDGDEEEEAAVSSLESQVRQPPMLGAPEFGTDDSDDSDGDGGGDHGDHETGTTTLIRRNTAGVETRRSVVRTIHGVPQAWDEGSAVLQPFRLAPPKMDSRQAIVLCALCGICGSMWSPLATFARPLSPKVHRGMGNPFVCLFLFVVGELIALPSVVLLSSFLSGVPVDAAWREVTPAKAFYACMGGFNIGGGYLVYFVSSTIVPPTVAFAISVCNPLLTILVDMCRGEFAGYTRTAMLRVLLSVLLYISAIATLASIADAGL